MVVYLCVFTIVKGWVLADLGEPLADLIVAWGCSAELGGFCGVPSSHSSLLRASASGPPSFGLYVSQLLGALLAFASALFALSHNAWGACVRLHSVIILCFLHV